MLIGEACVALFVTGGWDEALAMLEPVSHDAHGFADLSNIVGGSVLLDLSRGNVTACETTLDAVSYLGDYADLQARSMYWASRAVVLHASGRLGEAVDAGRRGMDDAVSTVPGPWVKQGFATAAAAALEVGDRATVEELLAWVDGLPAGRRPTGLVAEASRIRGRLAAVSGEPELVDREYTRAVELYTAMSAPFWAAAARVEWAELLSDRGATTEAAALAAQAATTLRSLHATPWLDRIRTLAPSLATAS